MTLVETLCWLRGCRGRPDGCASCNSGGHDLYAGLTDAAARLLDVSAVDLDEATGTIAVTCPTGTSFDAAEALRLELVAKVPTGVAVDVQIAPSLPGDLSAEDEAGERLHVAERAARLAPVRLEVDEEPFPWDE